MNLRQAPAVRTLAVLLAAAAAAPMPFAQTLSRADQERTIAALPDSERTFERFRYWMAGLPASERESSGRDELLARFSAWLEEGGFTADDARRQVEQVRRRGPANAAEFWNKYLVTERRDWLNAAPNAFLVDMTKDRRPGKALDVAMGQGRNAIWLARQGWGTTGFDPADQAVAAAQAEARRLRLKLHTEITTEEQFDFGENRWDLIVLSYAGCTQVAAKVQKALKPGGLVVVEAFHTDALKTLKIGGSLCGPAELPNAFKDLRVVRYEEPVARPDFAPRPARVVRFAAEKPAL